MKVTTALLCDFAQVREGLLFVSSGGLTRMWRQNLPAPLGAHLAMVIDMEPAERDRPHELAVLVLGEDGDKLAELKAGFQYGGAEDTGTPVEPTEILHLPIALNLAEVQLRSYGWHSVTYMIDGRADGSVSFLVSAPPQQPG